MSFDLAAKLREGYRFEHQPNGVNVFSPAGRHGFGADEEEAIANIDAQLLTSVPPYHPVAAHYQGRMLVRANGDEVLLDLSSLSGRGKYGPGVTAAQVVEHEAELERAEREAQEAAAKAAAEAAQQVAGA